MRFGIGRNSSQFSNQRFMRLRLVRGMLKRRMKAIDVSRVAVAAVVASEGCENEARL